MMMNVLNIFTNISVVILGGPIIFIMAIIFLAAFLFTITFVYGISILLLPIKGIQKLYEKIKKKNIDFDDFEKLIKKAGYAYDPVQDIFYSVINAWQRKFGYSRFYDEMAAHCSMIIDCEPFYFEYNGKNWLI